MDSSLAMIYLVAETLGPLCDEFVFVGGVTATLLITDRLAEPPRTTDDVDLVCKVATRLDYEELAQRLRARGLREDSRDGAPICRWRIRDLAVDVMPAKSVPSLGETNRWYPGAVAHAEVHELLADLHVRVLTAPYFLGTKLEAFAGRGAGDFQASHDLEDIVAVVNGRPTIADDVASSPADLRVYLAQRFSELLATPAFIQALPGHLASSAEGQARLPIVLARLRTIASGA